MILMTALDLFAKSDYRSVTIRDIAKACDINIALIYYYFDDKKKLFHDAIELAVREALGEYTKLVERIDNPVELINGWFAINIKAYRPLVKLVKVTVDYAHSDTSDPAIDALMRDLYDSEISLLQECFEEGIRRGEFRAVRARDMALFVSVHLDGIFLSSMIRADSDVVQLVANLRDILWTQLGHEPTTQPALQMETPALGVR